MNHRRKRRRRNPRCAICDNGDRASGNGSVHHQHFRSIEGRDPLVYYQTAGRHKVAPGASTL